MKNEKTLRLNQIMWRSIIFLFVLPLLLFWGLLLYTSTIAINKSIIAEQQNVVGLINTMLEKQIAQVDADLFQFSFDSGVQRILTETNFKHYNADLKNDYDYISKLVSKASVNKEIPLKNLILVNNQNQSHSNEFIPSTEENIAALNKWCDKVSQAKGKAVIIGVNKDRNGKDLFVIGKLVIEPQSRKFIGSIFLIYSMEDLTGPLKNRISNSADVFIATQDNNVLFSSSGNLPELQSFLTDNRTALESEGSMQVKVQNDNFTYIASPYMVNNKNELTAFSRVSFSDILLQLYNQQTYIVFLGVICIILFAASIFYVNRKLFNPIKKITSTQTAATDCYELKQISDTITSLTKKTNDGEEEIIKLIDRCDTTTLEKLQAQINPHFLYNTLTTIKYISMLNHQDQISNLISALVKLLRSTVSRDGDVVLLQEEIENISNYMLIQNTVYNGNIKFSLDILPETEKMSVPNFILQPMVENCIFHGIHPSEAGGEITVSSKLENSDLIIEIKDNGTGFDKDSLMNFMKVGDLSSKEHLTNLGIKAVHQKIQLLCGTEYGIKIFSKEHEGSVVRINLPRNENQK